MTSFEAREIIDAGFLELVRYGVRRADDPLIIDSLKVVDAVLKRDLPQGPCWLRYNHDGYGQRTDGGPFLGWGQGRAWPLLTGERAHYELAAGHDITLAHRHLRALRHRGQMLPEQVWDEAEPARRRACNSASPPALPCRSSGLTPSTSSCSARPLTARSSTASIASMPAIATRKAVAHLCRDIEIFTAAPPNPENRRRQDDCASSTDRSSMSSGPRTAGKPHTTATARSIGSAGYFADIPATAGKDRRITHHGLSTGQTRPLAWIQCEVVAIEAS